MLGENIERLWRNLNGIQFAAPDAAQRRDAFHQFIARQGKPAAFGQAAALMFRAADALEKGGDGTRGAQLANQIDRADINAQFQRRGGDERLQFAALEPILRVEAQFRREAAVMRSDLVLARAAPRVGA